MRESVRSFDIKLGALQGIISASLWTCAFRLTYRATRRSPSGVRAVITRSSPQRYDLVFWSLLVASAIILPARAVTADVDNYKTVDGLTVYLGVLPASMIRGHEDGHLEAAMHGGVPRGSHAYHVMVAVFDAESGERIEDALVQAEVAPLGLSATRKALDVMVIAGATTYGNYFTMRGDGEYRISVSIARPGVIRPVALEFTYEHSTR